MLAQVGRLRHELFAQTLVERILIQIFRSIGNR